MLAVILGAFGAHALKAHLNTDQLAWWETANRYHFYHAFAILLAALIFQGARLPAMAGYFFLAGIILFSGSLYLMALSEMLGLSRSILGPITPIGGLAFIAGWATLLWYGINR
jgi:uncharacterized membrane protein YgdD (TMEM256/DUF423 family)